MGMNWAEEELFEFRYECAEGHVSIFELSAKGMDYSAQRLCIECQEPASYAGFNPKPVNLTSMVAFDQNGRMGYRITDGKGGVTHMSQSKYNYLKSGGEVAAPVYTKEYEKHVRASGRGDILEKRNVLEERRSLDKRRAEAKKHSRPTVATSKEG